MTDLPDLARGCGHCGAIFSALVYYADSPRRGAALCPECGRESGLLGPLPSLVAKDGQHYLISHDGVRLTGPYESAEEAQNDLWEWFGEIYANEEDEVKEGTGEAEVVQERHLRLVYNSESTERQPTGGVGREGTEGPAPSRESSSEDGQ